MTLVRDCDYTSHLVPQQAKEGASNQISGGLTSKKSSGNLASRTTEIKGHAPGCA